MGDKDPRAVPPLVLQAIRFGLGDVDFRQRVSRVWFRPYEDLDAWHAEFDCGDYGFALAVGESGGCGAFAAVAGQLQDALGHASDSSSYQPTCGLHDHPATPGCIGGQALWRCPRGDDWSARIGSIRSPPRFVEPESAVRPTEFGLRVDWA